MIAIAVIAVLGIGQVAITTSPQEVRILGYDTSGEYSEKLPASQAISNVDDGINCSSTAAAYKSVETGFMRLVQLVKEPKILIKHCKVTYQVAIIDCSSMVRTFATSEESTASHHLVIEGNTCEELFETGEVEIQIDGIFSIKLKGAIGEKIPTTQTAWGGRDTNGKCYGTKGLMYQGKSYTNDLFEIHAEVELSYEEATFLSESNKIILPNKLNFINPGTGTMMDKMRGTFNFDQEDLPKNECDRYRQVLEGKGITHTPQEEDAKLESLVSIRTGEDLSITLMKNKETNICGWKAFSTMEPNLFILPDQDNAGLQEFGKINPPDVSEINDLRGRVSSISLSMAMRVSNDFHNVLKDICESRQEALRGYFSLMAEGQGHLGNTFGKLPKGVELINSGAASFLVYGTPVELKVRVDEAKCCKELPVKVINAGIESKNTYLDARTSILKPYCTHRPCNEVLPWYYRVTTIKGSSKNHSTEEEKFELGKIAWLMTKGSPLVMTSSEPPTHLNVMDKDFNFQIDELMRKENAKISIYDPEDLEQHRRTLLMGAAKRSMIASLVKKAIDISPGELPSLISHHDKDKHYKSFKDKILDGLFGHLWGYLINLMMPAGILVGLLALYVIYKGGLCLLRSTDDLSTTRRFGFHLGNTQEIKVLKERNRILENHFVQLNGDQKESDINQERIAHKVRNLNQELDEMRKSQKSLNPSVNFSAVEIKGGSEV